MRKGIHMARDFKVWAFLICSGALAFGQAKPGDKAGQGVPVDQASIDRAIEKGLAFLKTSDSPGGHAGDSDMLKLLTFAHGGVPESDPVFQTLLEKALSLPLEKTYQVSLVAMCLEEIDRVKYQGRIAQCGQFLLDNVKPNGGFAYGEPSAFVMDVPTGGRKNVASGGAKARELSDSAPGEKVKPKVEKTIKLVKRKEGPSQRSDSSNCQYAALGMRACHDAGVLFPKPVIELCRKYWEGSQHPGEKGKDRAAVASGGAALGEPRGWCYNDGQGFNECGHGGPAYSSMTAGAVGAVCIFDYMLGKDWKKDKVALDGLAWLDKNWSVTENVGPPETARGGGTGWLYYYLYALERTGMLYDTSLIGNHDWYFDGARVLLNAQKPDGSWDASHFKKPTWDACFAVLFLKRATRRLTASESGARK
jgi:hypothetical protein